MYRIFIFTRRVDYDFFSLRPRLSPKNCGHCHPATLEVPGAKLEFSVQIVMSPKVRMGSQPTGDKALCNGHLLYVLVLYLRRYTVEADRTIARRSMKFSFLSTTVLYDTPLPLVLIRPGNRIFVPST